MAKTRDHPTMVDSLIARVGNAETDRERYAAVFDALSVFVSGSESLYEKVKFFGAYAEAEQREHGSCGLSRAEKCVIACLNILADGDARSVAPREGLVGEWETIFLVFRAAELKRGLSEQVTVGSGDGVHWLPRVITANLDRYPDSYFYDLAKELRDYRKLSRSWPEPE
jgi:hypothetical protein